jgi:hypothetical protein
MPLRPFENMDSGGVDSRSNPLNFPRNRALRCLNWNPVQAGFWQLRYGYSSITMSTVTATAIHSMFPYRTWNGNKYVLFMQGTALKTLDTAAGTVTTPTVRGTAVASSAKGAGYFSNNRFHYGNGTDQKWFDSTTWRDNGLPSLTLAQVQNVLIAEGARELTIAEASTITLTAAAGGSFTADIGSGHLMYVVFFDTLFGELGPATISVSSGRIKVALSNKITIANMPNLSSLAPAFTYVKLMAGTNDGGDLAYFFTNTSTNLTSCTRAGVGLTIVATAHGLTSGDIVILAGTLYDSVYQVTVVNVNTFTVSLVEVSSLGNTGAVGTVKRIVTATAAATSIDVLAPTQDTSYQVNQSRGLPASTIGGPNAGYQFYASIYNPSGGGHVGNRIAIGGRALQTGYRSNWRIFVMPEFSGTDTEWGLLIGRTGDGATVPYALTDPAGNWFVMQGNGSGQTFKYITGGDLDGQHEMPTRNGIIPAQCNMFCIAGDFIYAADTGSPFLRRSGDLSQATERGDTFTGRPEQSWAPNDLDTFPTGEACTGIFEIDQEIFMGTLNDSALSANLAGIQQWAGGPWAVGIAGRRAGTKCGSWGFYWVSGEKQLCTFNQGVPVAVSDEYELAELSQIGDAFLSTVELVYYRNAAQNKDELRIEGQLASGTPYTIIHDFKLRDGNAPGSLYGQGYSSQFLGPLATVFTTALVRDGNGMLRSYAGASNGRIYQLNSGADDVGNQYTADLILLLNGGPTRPDAPFFDYYGDANVKITVGRNLSASLATGAQWGFEPPNVDGDVAQAVPGAEQDFLYRVFLVPPEVQRLYVRFQLTSHSADGNLNLNSPPHVPLENYGRIYELVPSVGDEREI